MSILATLKYLYNKKYIAGKEGINKLFFVNANNVKKNKNENEDIETKKNMNSFNNWNEVKGNKNKINKFDPIKGE